MSEWHLMAVYNLKTNKWKGLLNSVRGTAETMNVVYGRPVIQHTDKATLLYVHGMYVSGRTEAALFRVNLTTGVEQLVKQGGDATDEWVINDTGDIVAERDYLESSKRWSIRLFSDGRTRQTISGIAAIDAPDILGLSAGEDAVVVALTEGARIWKPLSIRDGTWGADLVAGESVTELLLKGGSQRMIGTGFVGDRTRYR